MPGVSSVALHNLLTAILVHDVLDVPYKSADEELEKVKAAQALMKKHTGFRVHVTKQQARKFLADKGAQYQPETIEAAHERFVTYILDREGLEGREREKIRADIFIEASHEYYDLDVLERKGISLNPVQRWLIANYTHYFDDTENLKPLEPIAYSVGISAEELVLALDILVILDILENGTNAYKIKHTRPESIGQTLKQTFEFMDGRIDKLGIKNGKVVKDTVLELLLSPQEGASLRAIIAQAREVNILPEEELDELRNVQVSGSPAIEKSQVTGHKSQVKELAGWRVLRVDEPLIPVYLVLGQIFGRAPPVVSFHGKKSSSSLKKPQVKLPKFILASILFLGITCFNIQPSFAHVLEKVSGQKLQATVEVWNTSDPTKNTLGGIALDINKAKHIAGEQAIPIWGRKGLVSEIARKNNVEDPDKLYPNQKIYVSGLSEKVLEEFAGKKNRINPPGETVAKGTGESVILTQQEQKQKQEQEPQGKPEQKTEKKQGETIEQKQEQKPADISQKQRENYSLSKFHISWSYVINLLTGATFIWLMLRYIKAREEDMMHRIFGVFKTKQQAKGKSEVIDLRQSFENEIRDKISSWVEDIRNNRLLEDSRIHAFRESVISALNTNAELNGPEKKSLYKLLRRGIRLLYHLNNESKYSELKSIINDFRKAKCAIKIPPKLREFLAENRIEEDAISKLSPAEAYKKADQILFNIYQEVKDGLKEFGQREESNLLLKRITKVLSGLLIKLRGREPMIAGISFLAIGLLLSGCSRQLTYEEQIAQGQIKQFLLITGVVFAVSSIFFLSAKGLLRLFKVRLARGWVVFYALLTTFLLAAAFFIFEVRQWRWSILLIPILIGYSVGRLPVILIPHHPHFRHVDEGIFHLWAKRMKDLPNSRIGQRIMSDPTIPSSIREWVLRSVYISLAHWYARFTSIFWSGAFYSALWTALFEQNIHPWITMIWVLLFSSAWGHSMGSLRKFIRGEKMMPHCLNEFEIFWEKLWDFEKRKTYEHTYERRQERDEYEYFGAETKFDEVELSLSVLGLKRGATAEEVKSRYRKLAQRCHPDKQHGKSQEEKRSAEERFKIITKAYQTLKKHYGNSSSSPITKSCSSSPMTQPTSSSPMIRKSSVTELHATRPQVIEAACLERTLVGQGGVSPLFDKTKLLKGSTISGCQFFRDEFLQEMGERYLLSMREALQYSPLFFSQVDYYLMPRFGKFEVGGFGLRDKLGGIVAIPESGGFRISFKVRDFMSLFSHYLPPLTMLVADSLLPAAASPVVISLFQNSSAVKEAIKEWPGRLIPGNYLEKDSGNYERLFTAEASSSILEHGILAYIRRMTEIRPDKEGLKLLDALKQASGEDKRQIRNKFIENNMPFIEWYINRFSPDNIKDNFGYREELKGKLIEAFITAVKDIEKEWKWNYGSVITFITNLYLDRVLRRYIAEIRKRELIFSLDGPFSPGSDTPGHNFVFRGSLLFDYTDAGFLPQDDPFS